MNPNLFHMASTIAAARAEEEAKKKDNANYQLKLDYEKLAHLKEFILESTRGIHGKTCAAWNGSEFKKTMPFVEDGTEYWLAYVAGSDGPCVVKFREDYSTPGKPKIDCSIAESEGDYDDTRDVDTSDAFANWFAEQLSKWL